MYKALAELELMMDRANDLVEFRIEAVLHEMSVTTLCELPDEEPWTVDKFLERTQVTDYVLVVKDERKLTIEVSFVT